MRNVQSKKIVAKKPQFFEKNIWKQVDIQKGMFIVLQVITGSLIDISLWQKKIKEQTTRAGKDTGK